MQSGDIEVKIDGPLAPYDFDFKVDETTGFIPGNTGRSFEIMLTFKSSLVGGDEGKYKLSQYS